MWLLETVEDPTLKERPILLVVYGDEKEGCFDGYSGGLWLNNPPLPPFNLILTNIF